MARHSLHSPRYPLAIAVALLLGAFLAWVSGQRFNLAGVHVLGLIVLGGLSLLPAVHRPIQDVLNRLRTPAPRPRLWIAIGITLVAILYLLGTALWHDRALFPKSHDENSYIIQARIFATGRLWMPLHPLADFFESFHILTRPVYAPIYFPGTALLNMPMAWFHLPVFVLPLVMAGAIVGLVYRVTTELIDGVAGALAALLTLSAFWFRANSTLVMSQSPAMLLGLLIVWSWLRWRQSPHWKWALAIGIFAGWAAVTRPVDALAFAVPVGIAMAAHAWRRPRLLWITTALPVLLGAIPFFTLQLLLNYGTTGSLLRTPYVVYLEQSQPATSFGYHAERDTPQFQTQLEQKKVYYNDFLGEAIANHSPGRLWQEIGRRLATSADAVVAWRVLIVLLPVSLLGLTTGGRWVIAAALPIFFLLYLLNTFYLEHYTIPLIAPVSFMLALGANVLAGAWQSDYLRGTTDVFVTLALAGLAIAALPELNPGVRDEFIFPKDRALAYKMIEERIEAPAVLLVRYDRSCNPHDEPVYNTDVAWPDDASVVRAHDLGAERNREIARYYAGNNPPRRFYLFDRRSKTLTTLGTASQFLARLEAQLSTHSATLPAPADAPP